MKKQTQNDTRWRVRQEEPVLRGSEVRTTLAERDVTHGDYIDDATTAIQTLELWQIKPGWEGLDYTKKHALTMIAVKVARILNGDPDHKDSWHDIAGYATLAEDNCE